MDGAKTDAEDETSSIKNDDLHGTNFTDSRFLPFALIPQIIDKYETRFWGVEQSELYKPTGIVIPKLPMYHPYHPFNNATHDVDGDDMMLQVPLAFVLPDLDLVPHPLMKFIKERNIDDLITPYFIIQTLPYDTETEVICRYQYCLFPDAKSEMMGHQSIWAQSIVYEQDKEINIPPTAVKIYESEKNTLSPTILCGNSMRLENVRYLMGKCIWSLVLGSPIDTVDHAGLFTEISRAFVGFTYFIPNADAYNEFLRLVRNKTPAEFIAYIPYFLTLKGTRQMISPSEGDRIS